MSTETRASWRQQQKLGTITIQTVLNTLLIHGTVLFETLCFNNHCIGDGETNFHDKEFSFQGIFIGLVQNEIWCSITGEGNLRHSDGVSDL